MKVRNLNPDLESLIKKLNINWQLKNKSPDNQLKRKYWSVRSTIPYAISVQKKIKLYFCSFPPRVYNNAILNHYVSSSACEETKVNVNHRKSTGVSRRSFKNLNSVYE